jgi:hypothetical protein
MNAPLLEPAAEQAVPVEALAEAPPAKEAIEIRPPDKITNIAELPSIWKLKQDIEWLVEDMLPLRSVNLLTAESGTGKTWVAHGIAGAIAHDRPFIGCKAKHRRVLYLDGENPLATVRRNVFELGIHETDHLKIWGGWNVEPPPGPDDQRIVHFAQKEGGVIIYDSLVEFNPGDEQSSTETREFMKKLRRLANLGATVLILHNAGKSKGSKQYRGSSDIKAAVDTAYFVEGKPRAGKIHRLTLENYKSRFAPGQNFAMELQSGRGFIPLGAPKKIDPPSPDAVVETIVKENPGLNGTEIKKLAKTHRISNHKVDECLDRGPYERCPGKGNSTHYTIIEEAPAESEISIFPAPIERKIENSTVPVEVEA